MSNLYLCTGQLTPPRTMPLFIIPENPQPLQNRPRPDTRVHLRCFHPSESWEPLNQSAATLSGSFAPTDRLENLEIRKGFLRFPNLNLERNPSLTTLAIESVVP